MPNSDYAISSLTTVFPSNMITIGVINIIWELSPRAEDNPAQIGNIWLNSKANFCVICGYILDLGFFFFRKLLFLNLVAMFIGLQCLDTEKKLHTTDKEHECFTTLFQMST